MFLRVTLWNEYHSKLTENKTTTQIKLWKELKGLTLRENFLKQLSTAWRMSHVVAAQPIEFNDKSPHGSTNISLHSQYQVIYFTIQ